MQLTASGDVKNTTGGGFNFVLWLYSPYLTTANTRTTTYGNYLRNQATGYAVDVRGSAIYKAVERVDAVQFLFNSGDVASGTLSIYGVVNS